MEIRKIIRDIVPYGIIERRRIKNNKKNKCIFDTKSKLRLEDVPSKFKNIISVQGFGYSGHTALINLFQEYSSIQSPTKGELDSVYPYEVDWMRLGGGILEYEKFLDSNNIFQNDALFHRLISQLSDCDFFNEDRAFIDITSAYLTSLLEFQVNNLTQVYFNRVLANSANPDTSIYYIKQMSLASFRNLSRMYINNILNTFAKSGKDTIMLNHFFSDFEYNNERNQAYVPGIKILSLYRDPRDVYYFSKLNNVEWIPHTKVEDFVLWCKMCYRNFKLGSEDYFTMSFEDLVLNYENSIEKIENYVGLNSSDHIEKYKYLNPEVSKNNIGQWKKAFNLQSDMEYIFKELSQYCYG